MLCYVVPDIYRCDGTPICVDPTCRQSFTAEAKQLRQLGWLPDPSACAAKVIERLGLSPEVPDVDCPNRVTQYLWWGEFYYLVSNIGLSCNSVEVVYTCEGDQACVLATGNDCAADWQETAFEIRVLGYY